MSIESIQKTLANVPSFEAMYPIAKKAKLHQSFFGRFYIAVEGYKGSLGLDALEIRLIKLIKKTNYEFDEKERKFGDKIDDKIHHIYYESKELISKSNIITKVFNFIGLIFKYFFPDLNVDLEVRRDYYMDYNYVIFAYYTKNQYVKVFGKEPKEDECIRIYGFPKRWKSPVSDLHEPLARRTSELRKSAI